MKVYAILSFVKFLGMIWGCGSAVRKDFEESLSKPIEIITYYASLAGNSHNTQPWIVSVENDTIVYIKADFSRKLNVVDPNARGLFISLGAFIHNFELAAKSLGYKTNTYILAERNQDSIVAKIELIKAEKSNYDLNQIINRRTLRTPFSNQEISANHINTLTNNNQNIFYFSSSSEKGKYIAQKTLAAYTQQANDERAKQELANWMRFSNNDVRKYRDGLTTAGMGITGISGFFVRNFFTPEKSMEDGFIQKGIEKTKEQVENCGGWILIIQNEDNPKNWIETGRLYQSMNLLCRKLMIGFHPMNQMIEEENFNSEVSQKLNLPGKIQFVARIGYVDEYPPAISVRRTVKDIIYYQK